MTNRSRMLVVLSAMTLIAMGRPRAVGETSSNKEYQVKAAFLYNFIKFVEWPKGVVEQEKDKPISVGIIGKDPFGTAFDPLAEKLVENKKVVVKRFKGMAELKESAGLKSMADHPDLETILKCRVIFICKSEKKCFKEILASTEGHPVLTVGDSKSFLEVGGVINFVIENQKVRFEICQGCAKQSELQIHSQLLRLARRVLKGKSEHTDKH